MERFVYPFSAIVGQDKMKLALVLNAIHPAIGGVLIRGEKGTGKSTAVRALARLLPDLNVVADCLYRCDPDAPEALCSDCQDRVARGEALPRGRRRMRVVELPINASEDRVVGAIDIEAAIKSGERRFEPGVLAEANRNILYVDEVNLLDDHLVDDLVGRKASQALAAYRGVPEVGVPEVNEVADMVLAHRVKAGGRRELGSVTQSLPSASRASRSS